MNLRKRGPPNRDRVTFSLCVCPCSFRWPGLASHPVLVLGFLRLISKFPPWWLAWVWGLRGLGHFCSHQFLPRACDPTLTPTQGLPVVPAVQLMPLPLGLLRYLVLDSCPHVWLVHGSPDSPMLDFSNADWTTAFSLSTYALAIKFRILRRLPLGPRSLFVP